VILFAAKFPEVASHETRVVTLTQPNPLLPPDGYAFVEVYCDEKGCDCRRALFWVMAESQEEKPIATISFGFDPEAEMAGPFLDPFGPQSEFSEALLGLFVSAVLTDPAYVQRLYRHYTLMREKVDGRPYRGRPFPEPHPRRPQPAPRPGAAPARRGRSETGRNEACPCGSGKKRKRCCGLDAAPALRGAAPRGAAAEDLVARAARSIARGEANFVTQEVAARLFQEPELGSRVLDQFLAEPAVATRGGRIPPRYAACLALVEAILTELRFSVERGREWAQAALAGLQRDLAERVFRPGVPPELQSDILTALASAGVAPAAAVRGAVESAALAHTPREPGADLEALVAGLTTKGPAAVYELWELLFAHLQALDADDQLAVLEALIRSSAEVLREAALLLLLHPLAQVRQGVTERLLGTPAVVSPLGLRRLVLVRNWLPEAERPALDALVRRCREARVEPVPLRPQAVTQRLVAPFDGSGATAFCLVFRNGRRLAVGGAVLKEGFGVRDPWCHLGMRQRELDDLAGHLRRETGARGVPEEFLNALLGHFLWVGAREGRPPAPPLLQVAELAGPAGWSPRPLDFAQALAELEQAPGATALEPSLAERARTGTLAGTEHFRETQSWFEDDAETDRVVVKALGGSRSPAAQQKAVARVIDELLEPRRQRWLERMVWTTLWARCTAGKGKPNWQELALVARELHRGRPLRELLLMEQIAERTVGSAMRRQELQKEATPSRKR